MNRPETELVLVARPGAEPLQVSEAKLFLKVDISDDDDLIASLITASREYAEKFCRRSFTAGEQWRLSLDHFPLASIRDSAYFNLPADDLWENERDYLYTMPRALAVEVPMGSITITSITYLDTDGNQQALDPSAYTVVPDDDGNTRIYPAYMTAWPSTRFYPAAINIAFTTGSLVPQSVVLAMKQMLSFWYNNRESVIMAAGVTPQNVPMMAEFLLWPYRLLEL